MDAIIIQMNFFSNTAWNDKAEGDEVRPVAELNWPDSFLQFPLNVSTVLHN